MKYLFLFVSLWTFNSFVQAYDQCLSSCSSYCQEKIEDMKYYIEEYEANCSDNGSHLFRCKDTLAKKRQFWSADDLALACRGANADCIARTADVRMFWNAQDLNKACRNRVYACIEVVLAKRQFWSVDQANTACTRADKTCITRTLESQPFWSPEELNKYCRP